MSRLDRVPLRPGGLGLHWAARSPARCPVRSSTTSVNLPRKAMAGEAARTCSDAAKDAVLGDQDEIPPDSLLEAITRRRDGRRRNVAP